MSKTRLAKIRQSIDECDRYIAKEGARSADLRPPETAALLQRYVEHREKLIAMEAAEAAPVVHYCFCGAPGRGYPSFGGHTSYLCDLHANN